MKRVIAAVVAFIAMVLGFTAAPAQAGNGTQDFYLAASCWPAGSNGARLSVTNWDNSYVGQQYHMDLNSDRSTSSTNVPLLKQHSIRVDGVWVPGTEGVYKRFSANWGRHTITGYWTNVITGKQDACSVRL